MSVVFDKALCRWLALAALAQARAALAQEAPPPPPAAAVPVESQALEASRAQTQPPRSWFTREPLRLEAGADGERWAVTFFGFIEADYIFDSTRSYEDAVGNALVARSDTYAGRAARSQFSVRNTRLGLLLSAPRVAGIQPSARLEGDFFGNQPQGSERAFFDSPAFRLRHAYLQLHSDYVDVLAGHSYTLLGFQNYFFPCTLEFLGVPNQVFSRAAQLRLSRSIPLTGELSLELAAAAVRPGQRDAAVPDFQAGVRLAANGWKGITTPGNTGTAALPLSVGVSGVVRQFKVNAFAPPPTQRSNSASGWGLALDALLPVIPAAHSDDRANRLTLTGSFVTGSGIADLITAGGGASFPTLPNPAQANPAPLYTSNIDDGLVSFDTRGVLHTIDWWALRAGVQYYLPPSGRLIVSANYTQSHSGNLRELFPRGGAEIELLARVADRSHYADLNLMWDATPSVRLGLSGQYTKVIYLDGNQPHNLRAMAQALYLF